MKRLLVAVAVAVAVTHVECEDARVNAQGGNN